MNQNQLSIGERIEELNSKIAECRKKEAVKAKKIELIQKQNKKIRNQIRITNGKSFFNVSIISKQYEELFNHQSFPATFLFQNYA